MAVEDQAARDKLGEVGVQRGRRPCIGCCRTRPQGPAEDWGRGRDGMAQGWAKGPDRKGRDPGHKGRDPGQGQGQGQGQGWGMEDG